MRRRIEDYRQEYLTPDHQAFLAEHFPSIGALGTIGKVSLLEGGVDNVNLLVCDDAGVPRFVARHYLISSASKIAGEFRLVARLAESGYPTPPPILTVLGKLFLDRRHEPVIAVFPFVTGTVARTWSHEQRRTAAETIADLHFRCQRNGFWNGIVRDRVQILQSGASRIAELQLPGYAELAGEIAEFLACRLKPQEKCLQSLPTGPVHHDLNYGNVIWRGEEIAAIIDFDECHDAPFILDLVASFSYLAIDAAYQLQWDACLAILEGYERVRPLESEELQLLPLAWELFNLVDGVEYLLGNADRAESVYDSRSYAKLYLRQKSRLTEFVDWLSRSR